MNWTVFWLLVIIAVFMLSKMSTTVVPPEEVETALHRSNERAEALAQRELDVEIARVAKRE